MPQATDAVWVSVLPDMSRFGSTLASGTSGAATDAGNDAGKKFGKALLAGVAVVGAGAALATKALVDIGTTFSNLSTDIAVATGASGDHLNGLVDAAKRVASNVPVSFEEVGAAVSSVEASLGGFANMTEAEFDRATTNALNFSKAFEIDLDRATQVAGQMLKSGLVQDADEAFDLMVAASQKVPASLRESILDAADEYGPFFAQLGISGEGAMNALVAAADKGAIGIDKTGDALKEFTIRATDMSTATGAAYDVLGLNQADMTSALLAGGDTASEAFQSIVGGLRDMEDPIAQSQAALALFGTPLEDFGTENIPAFIGSLTDATDVLGDVEGAASRMGEELNSGPAAAFDVLKNKIMVGLEPVATRVFGALSTAVSWLVDVGVPALQRFGDQIRNGFTGDLEGALTPMEKVGAAARSVFDYVRLTAIPNLRDFGGWVQKNSGWLIPLGAGIAAIAVSIGLVVGALKVWRAITVAFTAVQAALNVVLALNPIGVIVLAIVGLVAAFVVAYKRSETFRDIVQGAWEGIKNAATTAWDWIRDKVFAPISTGLQVVWGAFVTAKDGISTAMSAVGSALSWVYDNIIKPVWDGIQSAISFAWGIIKPILDANIAVFTFLGQVFWNVWTLVIQVAWIALQAAFKAGWDFIRTFVFDPLRLAWDAVGAGFSWVWANIIAPMWSTFQTVLSAGWNFIRDYVFAPINRGVSAVGDAFTSAKDTAGRAWDGLKSAASAAWTWIKDNVFDPFGKGISAIGDAFNAAKDVVGAAWDAIQSAAVKPVNFVIDTVYNNGIKALFDTVAEKLGLSQRLPSISTIGQPQATSSRPVNRGMYADGGVLPGYTPGRDVHDFYSPTAGWLHLSGGEGILRPEAVRDLGGAAGIAAINSRYTGRGAGGGKSFFLGGIWDAVKNGAGAAWDFTTDAASAIGNFMKDPVAGAVKVFSAPIEELLKKIGGGDVGQIIAGAPRALIKGIIDGATRIFGPARDDGTDPAKAGSVSPGGSPMGVAAMSAALQAVLPGARVTSGFRRGARVAGTGNLSMHGMGRAIDIGNPTMGMFNTLLAAYPNATELLYSPAGGRQRQRGRGGSFAGDTSGATRAMHYDHIHWGMFNGGIVPKMPAIQAGVFDNGGMLQPGGIAVNLSNRPEPVFSSQQWDTMRSRESGPVVGEINVTSSDPEAAARAVVRRFEDAASLSDLDMISKGF